MAAFWPSIDILDFQKQFRTVYLVTASQDANNMCIPSSKEIFGIYFFSNTSNNLTYNILRFCVFSEWITPWSIGWVWEVVFGGGKTTWSILSSQFEDEQGNCRSLMQLSFLQKQISSLSLWPTLQTILHSSNFFVDSCSNRIKNSRFSSTVAFWPSQSQTLLTYLRRHLLLPSLWCIFYLAFCQSTLQT